MRTCRSFIPVTVNFGPVADPWSTCPLVFESGCCTKVSSLAVVPRKIKLTLPHPKFVSLALSGFQVQYSMYRIFWSADYLCSRDSPIVLKHSQTRLDWPNAHTGYTTIGATYCIQPACTSRNWLIAEVFINIIPLLPTSLYLLNPFSSSYIVLVGNSI
jgi:hypothetical protein